MRVFIWDLVAAVVMTDSRLCPEVPIALNVIVEAGPEQGRTVVSDEPVNANVCLKPSAEQIKALAASILSSISHRFFVDIFRSGDREGSAAFAAASMHFRGKIETNELRLRPPLR